MQYQEITKPLEPLFFVGGNGQKKKKCKELKNRFLILQAIFFFFQSKSCLPPKLIIEFDFLFTSNATAHKLICKIIVKYGGLTNCYFRKQIKVLKKKTFKSNLVIKKAAILI